MKRSSHRLTTGSLGVLLAAGACAPAAADLLQGYVEGEFVHVAAPHAGELQQLPVHRGDQVATGALLFGLEDTAERAALERATGLLEHARATLADEQKGVRPSELASLQAQLGQAQAARQLADIECHRIEKLVPSGGASQSDLDRARATLERDAQRTAQLEADLQTARLGAREDRIAASEADVRTLQAEVARASWDLEQRRQAAPAGALVFDTLYREGDWVGAGDPVVVLLPPANVKVRAFVPEPRIGAVRVGDAATVHVDGVVEPARGKVTFVSPRAEYTPPVIFSRETRAKLVFLVELRFDDATAARLHPGQPVDVRIEGR
jgi:HlyD family secretion protein